MGAQNYSRALKLEPKLSPATYLLILFGKNMELFLVEPKPANDERSILSRKWAITGEQKGFHVVIFGKNRRRLLTY